MSCPRGLGRKLRLLFVVSLLGLFACTLVAEAQAKQRVGKNKKRRKKTAAGKAKLPDGATPTEAAAQDTPATSGSDVIEIERVLAHAEKLAVEIGPRPANSAASGQASQYIEAELAALGLEVQRLGVGTQIVPAIDLGMLYQSAERSFASSDANLVVHIAPKGRAKDKPILFMAHYDSVPDSPGVVDNAVAVGLLLELARVLQRTPPARPTILAWTAAEENGLIGARALAKKYAEDLGLAVSLDLVGSPGHLTLNGLSSLIHQHWLLWLAEVSDQAKVDVRAPWTHRAVSRILPEVERSDHGPFAALGAPAIHLYHRSDEAIFLPYHTRHDTMAQADRTSIEDAAKMISMMCHTHFAMPTAGESPGLWLPLPGGAKVISSTAVQFALVVLLLIALVSMINLSRAAKGVPKAKALGRRLGLGSAMLIYICTWGISGLVIKLLLGGGEHALPWVHAPGRVIVAGILMAAAMGYVAATQASRLGTWVGDGRYLMPAIAYTSLVGFFMLAFGFFELAWIVLLPSAALGAVGGSKKFASALIAFVTAALPVWGPLRPSFLREMVFNSFWIGGLPLFAYVGLVLMPSALAVVFLVRRYSLPTPRGRVAMSVCVGVVVVSAIIVGSYTVPCSGEDYRLEGLSCEIGR